MNNEIIVSGMRPTGRLHLGNYHGALKNWVALQHQYKCFFFVADLHSLTTAYDNTQNLAANSEAMLIDWLTAGIDPKAATLFVQSEVSQISELTVLLGMITPLGWLLRNPTYKEQINELLKKKFAGQLDGESLSEKVQTLSDEDISSYGFLGYPVLMGTDIIIHKAAFVPVGQDQVPHIEIARDMVRRFTEIYGEGVLIEPKPLLTKTTRVPGTDGRKMSKSYGNTIELGEELESVRKKVMGMFTDPNKKRANDPGNPENCVVFAFHKIYNPDAAKRCEECKAGALGCVACKKQLFELMEPELKDFLERRKQVESDKGRLAAILRVGKEAARESAQKTLTEVKKLMKVIS